MEHNKIVHSYFRYELLDNKSKCRECDVKISGKHSENLKRHLKRKHEDIYDKIQEKINQDVEKKTCSSTSQRSLSNYVTIEKGKKSFATVNVHRNNIIKVLSAICYCLYLVFDIILISF